LGKEVHRRSIVRMFRATKSYEEKKKGEQKIMLSGGRSGPRPIWKKVQRRGVVGPKGGKPTWGEKKNK